MYLRCTIAKQYHVFCATGTSNQTFISTCPVEIESIQEEQTMLQQAAVPTPTTEMHRHEEGVQGRIMTAEAEEEVEAEAAIHAFDAAKVVIMQMHVLISADKSSFQFQASSQLPCFQCLIIQLLYNLVRYNTILELDYWSKKSVQLKLPQQKSSVAAFYFIK